MDACRLTQAARGWRLEGSAAFLQGDATARLRYEVQCDESWDTVGGAVEGAIGTVPLSLAIERGRDGTWVLNGRPLPELQGLVDLDLGFTPATNLFPIRRLALSVGDSGDAEAAWLDDANWSLVRLPQRYQRRSETEYWYESPTNGYAGLLVVDADGFVRDYPGLWIRTRP